MSYQLIDLIEQIGTPRILVLGDLILDRYIWGDAERVSQEAPVILLREESKEIRLGGAANVANMLRGLSANVTMAGVVGNDADGKLVCKELEKSGVDCSCIVLDSSRPTTVKERYLGRAQHRHPHQILRVDREVRTAIERSIADQIFDIFGCCVEEFQAVLISDYAKGVCTPYLVQKVIEAAKKMNIPVIADPSSSGDCTHFKGATAITPNRLETKRATGREIETTEDAFAAGHQLCKEHDLEYAFVTLDSDGIAVTQADGTSELLSTRRREVYDITGAGDMVIAMIGMGASVGIAPANLARLANIAGGLEVEQIGVVTISKEEILTDLLASNRNVEEKVDSLEVVARHVAARQKMGQRVVMTNGCFDLLHVGHVGYLQQAANEGDCLVVAINDDASVRSLSKGKDRPIFHQEHRATMLAALEAVDYVVTFSESTPHKILEKIKPDLLVKGGTYSHDEIVGWELVESYGGEVKALGITPGISTTDILNHLRSEETEPIHHLKLRKAG